MSKIERWKPLGEGTMNKIKTPPLSHTGPAIQPLCVDEATAAEMLGVSARTFWDLRKAGEIQHIKIGRLVRYAVDDLKAFLRHKREETRAEGANQIDIEPATTDK
jgi:excisionase family DNA binding protein